MFVKEKIFIFPKDFPVFLMESYTDLIHCWGLQSRMEMTGGVSAMR